MTSMSGHSKKAKQKAKQKASQDRARSDSAVINTQAGSEDGTVDSPAIDAIEASIARLEDEGRKEDKRVAQEISEMEEKIRGVNRDLSQLLYLSTSGQKPISPEALQVYQEALREVQRMKQDLKEDGESKTGQSDQQKKREAREQGPKTG